MAKQGPIKTGTAKIRFIMLDAEIPEGDLSQITIAIQNALKPTTIVQQRMPSQIASPAVLTANNPAEPVDEHVSLASGDDVEALQPRANKPRPARSRKPTTPEVLEADFDSPVSLQDFSDSHPVKGEIDRNLVIAVWFKEHRGISAVKASHIYTGYRKLGWGTGFEDFTWPLRKIKKDRLASSTSRGEYEVNHLAIDRVNKLGKNVD